MNKIASLHRAARSHASSIILIVLGTAALLTSFIDVTGSNPAFFAIAGFAMVTVIPILIGYLSRWDDESAEYYLAAFGSIAFAFPVFCSMFDTSCLGYTVWIPVLICGIPIVCGAIRAVIFEHDITADLLVSIAIIAAVLIGEPEAAAEVAIIMQVGALLEETTTDHAKTCLTRLHDMEHCMGRVIRNGKELKVSSDAIRIGETVRILPGERIPVDGKVVSGETSVDTSVMTGESLPRDIAVGDMVSAGCINLYGSIDMVVTSTSGDSAMARMARLIEEADAGRSPIVRAADRWASVIVILALSISAITYALTMDAVRAVTVLVVFCPCALVLATPTAIMAAVATASRHGIIVKNGESVENLARIDTVLLDKTGTLTTGRMTCIRFVPTDDSISSAELGRIAASTESRSEHPLGKAICEAVADVPESESFAYIPGRGVSATVDGERVFLGNRGFVSENCPGMFAEAEAIAASLESEGYVITFIGRNGMTVGVAVLSDTVKPAARSAVRRLRMVGLSRIMLTGDSANTASRVSGELGMDDVVWECLPGDKLRIVSSMDSGRGVCMVGDGINDAPSLRRASVGIAMGGIGNDIAIESSDIVFLEDDLTKLPGLIRTSRRTLTTIHAGIAFSLIINFAATILASMGMIGPVEGALVHNIGSVIVILAAAAILRYDPWKPSHRHHGSAASAASA